MNLLDHHINKPPPFYPLQCRFPYLIHQLLLQNNRFHNHFCYFIYKSFIPGQHQRIRQERNGHTFLSYAYSVKHTHTVKSGRHSKLVSDVVVVDLTRRVDIETIAVAIRVDTPEGAGPQVATSVLYDSHPQIKLPIFICYPLLITLNPLFVTEF